MGKDNCICGSGDMAIYSIPIKNILNSSSDNDILVCYKCYIDYLERYGND